MNLPPAAELRVLLDELVSHGVTRFTLGDLSIELAERAPARAPETRDAQEGEPLTSVASLAEREREEQEELEIQFAHVGGPPPKFGTTPVDESDAGHAEHE